MKIKIAYNGRGIAFDRKVSWSFGDNVSRNVLVFVVDNSSSSHIDNQKNNFFVLGKGTTDDIDDSTGVVETKI